MSLLIQLDALSISARATVLAFTRSVPRVTWKIEVAMRGVCSPANPVAITRFDDGKSSLISHNQRLVLRLESYFPWWSS